MTKDDVESALARSLDDHRLSRAERKSLLEAFELVRGAVGAHEIRRLSFELARKAMPEAGAAAVLDWLEGVLRLVDRLEAPAGTPVFEAHFSPREECWRRI